MVHNKTKIIIGIATTLLLVTVGMCAGFFYLVEQHKLTLNEQMIKIAQERTRKDNLAALVRTVESSKEERSNFTSRIITEEQVIDLLALIETVGREQGTTLATKSLTANPLNATFEELEIHLEATGTYEAVVNTLGLLEQLPYQSRVTQVLITNSGDEEKIEWNASFVVLVTKFKKI